MIEDQTEIIRFKKLHPDAKLPTRGSEQAAGLDLYSIEPVTIDSGKCVAIRTGISAAVRVGFYGRVAPRSGLAVEYGIGVLAGVVDSDYRGEIICVLINHGDITVQLDRGTRIAQLIIEVIIIPKPEWANSLEDTARGSAGFGSTDKD